MANLTQDIRYGWRGLRKSPGFTAVAVLVLALGIGANTAIFSVVNAVLLRPLPFDQPERLVQLYHVPPQSSFPGVPLFSLSAANFLDWRAQAQSFEGMSAYGFGRYTLTGKGEPEAVRTVAVTNGFFSVLHAQPLLGRVFLAGEDEAGRDHEVVLSYDLWRTRFNADPELVGKTIELNDEPYTVVGVMQPGFEFPLSSDFRPQMWKPQSWTAQDRANRDDHNYGVIARLKPGVTLAQAKAELSTISDRLAQQYPKDDKGWGGTAIPMREDLVGEVRPGLLILLGAVGFVLLIACANVANLVLARTLARRKEIAVRSALGASRRRLLQQVLAETVLLAIAGGAFGLLFAHYGTVFIVKFAGQQLPRSRSIGLDGWVLAFTFSVSLLAGIMAGLLPALRLTKTDISEALKQGQSRTVSDSGGHGTRGALVVGEVALSLMLLIGAGLLIRTLWALHSVRGGFDPDHVVTMFLSVAPNKFATPEQQISFYDRVMQQVRALPGVQSAALADSLPLTGSSQQPIQAEGQPVLPMADQPEVNVILIGTEYMSTMHIPLLRGREFNNSDVNGRPRAVLISESLARQFWGAQDPMGKRLNLYFFPGDSWTVVGVVGDVKIDALTQTRPASTVYMPLGQLSPARDEKWRSFGMMLAARTRTDPLSVASAIGNAVHSVDPEVPLLNIKSMQERVDDSLLQQRFTMFLLAGFAGLALLLAAVGIYSVLAYAVRRRVREIGLRMALGAQVRDVLRMVVVEGMKPTLMGVVLGVGGALALGRVLSSVIYGVSARDLATFGIVAVLMTGVGLLASVLPAYRATRVDPMKTLREE